MPRILPVLLSIWVSQGIANADSVIPVTTDDFRNWKTHPAGDAPAEVIALREARIPSEINARIVALKAEVGDQVSAEQGIARLDCTSFQHALQRSLAQGQALDAQRSLARQQLKRTRELVKQRSASEELVDQRQADLSRLNADRQAQNAVIASARNDVEHCEIRAPFNGTITERRFGIGDYVTTGSALFTILDPDAVELEAAVPFEQLASLRRSHAIRFKQDFPVSLRAALPTVSVTTGQQNIRMQFIGPKPLAGMTGRIRWQSPDRAVPAELLVRRNGELGIFVAADGTARFHPLPRALEGRPAVVDLSLDTRLIIDGREAVTHGQSIRIVDSE